jgi:type VI protein secretion system component Hcp
MKIFRRFLCSLSNPLLIFAATGMLLSANSAQAAFEYYVKIFSKDQGILTTNCGIREKYKDYCASMSYSSSAGFPVDSTLPKYGPVQIVFELNRVHPRLLDMMVKREPLSVLVEFTKYNMNGEEYVFHTVFLENARVIDVRRWTGSTLPSAYEVLNLSTVTFDYVTISETNNEGATSFIGSKK